MSSNVSPQQMTCWQSAPETKKLKGTTPLAAKPGQALATWEVVVVAVGA